MSKENLHNIIGELEKLTAYEQASFGIFNQDTDQLESTINANKEGLQLFALALLKAAEIIEDNSFAAASQAIPLEVDEDWINSESHIFIKNVKPVTVLSPNEQVITSKNTIADKLIPVGCICIFLLLLVSTVVGFWTLLTWIF